MKFKYYSDKRIVLCCLFKVNKYSDMNEISKSVVNTLLFAKNKLSSALVFLRDYKIKGLSD